MKKGLFGLLAVTVLAVAPAVHATAPAGSNGNRTGGSSSIDCNDGRVTWTPTTIWPPNHRMRTVAISYDENENDGDEITVTVKSIVHDQAAADGTGELPGSGQPFEEQGLDWAGVTNTGRATDPDAATTSADVRAERSGTDKTGRTYTITVTCTDTGGNHEPDGRPGTPQTEDVDLTVAVPHDQGHR